MIMIIFVYDVNDKILSLESNYIVNEVIWPKFSSSSISVREAIKTLIL